MTKDFKSGIMNRCFIDLVVGIIVLIGCCHVLAGTASSIELFAVGDHGTSYRYDGSEWHAITHTSRDNNRIWAFSETDIYVICSNSNIYHYNGEFWRCAHEFPDGVLLNEIWASSPTDMFVAGADGSVFRYDGADWTDVSIPSGTDVNSIWGIPNEAYAACDAGGFHYTLITGWLPVDWPVEYSSYRWNAVWCDGEDEVYFVSDPHPELGTIIAFFDGHEWSTMQVPETRLFKPIRDMWGVSSEFIYAVGDSGTVLYFDYKKPGQPEWIDKSAITSCNFSMVSGTSGEDVYIGGYHNNWDICYITYSLAGGAWQMMVIDEYVDNHMSDVFALPEGPVFIAGNNDNFGHLEEDQYVPWTLEITATFVDVWASAPDNVYAVGSEGGIYNFDGNSWGQIAKPTNSLKAIWGSSENDIYAGGENVYHYDGVGESWDLFLDDQIIDIWGTSGNNVYFTGQKNIYQYNGSGVDQIGDENSPLWHQAYAMGIWASDENNVFLCAGSHFIGAWDPIQYIFFLELYRYDGLAWHDMNCCQYNWLPTESAPYYYGAIWGSGPDNVWATGIEPHHALYDGDSWEWVQEQFSGKGIWGTAPDNIYFCSNEDGVYRYDGVGFVNVFPLVDLTLYAIYGVEENLTPVETPATGLFLSQNHPNPFNPSTTISFSLREKCRASLVVYDVAGRLVRVLLDGVMEAGPHEVAWDGRNRDGSAVASGVYFYRLKAKGFVETKKMVLLR